MADNHDLEARLRQSLAARAQDVRPDPTTWARVSGRIRRERTFRLGLAGVTTAAVLVLGALVVPAALNRPDVDLGPGDDPAPPSPSAEPGETDPPVAGGFACGGPEHVAAVLARSGTELEGTLWALCDDGSERHLSEGRPEGARDVNPAFAPDGSAIVFERVEAGGTRLLVHLDLTSGQEQVLGGGAHPAFAPDGRLAWAMPVEEGQDLILIGRPFSEPEAEFPVVDGEDGEWFDVRDLAWDATGGTLYAEAGYEESVVFSYDVSGSGGSEVPGERLMEPIAEERYAAPSMGPEGFGIAVLARCCLVDDGDAFTRAELRLVDSEDGRLVSDQLPPEFDADGDVWTAYARIGELREVEGTGLSWSGGTRSAWLVGDGEDFWIVEGDGTVHGMGLEVTGAAANPALATGDGPGQDGSGGDAGELEAQQGLPAPVEDTRQALYEAVVAGDWETIESLMSPDFTSSFGGASGPGEAISMLRAMEEDGQDPLGLIATLLETPYGVLAAESAGTHYFWPGPFVRMPEEWTEEDLEVLRRLGTEEEIQGWRDFGGYIGWRIGITENGAWTVLVAGD